MPPAPLYNPHTASAAYQLRYSWTAWPSGDALPESSGDILESVKPLWEGDGMRALEWRWLADRLQILFSTKPGVSPVFLAGRAKGRLDHVLRKAGRAMSFSRKIGVQSLGENTRRDVEAYIENQSPQGKWADPRWAETLAEFTVTNGDVDLSEPTESARGRYWYNLHLVLVAEDRSHAIDAAILRRMCDCFLRIAAKKGHRISRLAVMPDHLHASLRGNIEEAPADVVFAYQNNLAFMLGQGRIWRDSYYVGTFGEYPMSAIRRAAEV